MVAACACDRCQETFTCDKDKSWREGGLFDLKKFFIADCFCLDETTLKVVMDHTRCLRRLEPPLYCPRTRFLFGG